jgi:Tfp pilus assembly protein PilF
VSASVIDFGRIRADKLTQKARIHIADGNMDDAIEAFHKSIESHPTAEAYTNLAWVLSLKGEYDMAIEHCKTAISLDSDLGNPYNDIGSYLIRKARYMEAIPWLERAIISKRYDTRHFPHINLGRIYTTIGRVDSAIEEFHKALAFAPKHPEIEKVLEHLQKLKS